MQVLSYVAQQGYQNSLNSTLGFTYNPPPLYFKSHSVMQLSKYRAAGLQAIARQLAAGRATLSPLSPDIDFEIQWHPLGVGSATVLAHSHAWRATPGGELYSRRWAPTSDFEIQWHASRWGSAAAC